MNLAHRWLCRSAYWRNAVETYIFPWVQYWELCERIQDLPRHLGQHSGGMVVCQELRSK
jgi:hypothetical protein